MHLPPKPTLTASVEETHSHPSLHPLHFMPPTDDLAEQWPKHKSNCLQKLRKLEVFL